jgi:hypothetical protein
MKKLILVLSGALVSLTAVGQDLLQCVNPDVVNSLLFHGRADLHQTVTRGLPADLADVAVPGGFELIGGAVRDEMGIATVAFKTHLDSDEAFAALLASSEAKGWELEDDTQPFMARVFNLSSGPTTGTICLNGERRSLRVRDVAGNRYATVATQASDRPRDCNAPDPRLAMRPPMPGLATGELPSLYLPESVREPNGNPLGGGSGMSGANFSTSVQVASPESGARIADHLAGQMVEQGWLEDGRWTGALSAGSSWTRQAEDGVSLAGTIEIVDLGDDQFHVSFRMRTLY